MGEPKKITHVIYGLEGDSPFAGSGRGVYGEKDLKRLQKIAAEAGLPVRVHEVTEED